VVDPDAVKRAEDWLIKQQHADGSWNKKYDWEKTADERQHRRCDRDLSGGIAP
jgi:hypothetical protein